MQSAYMSGRALQRLRHIDIQVLNSLIIYVQTLLLHTIQVAIGWQLLPYSADISITTDTTSNLSSTCVVLVLMAGRLDCQPRPNSQQQTLQLFLSSFRRQQFYLAVNIASEMHFSALRCLTQPCITAYCIWHITYDPGISPGSANQCMCIWDPIYQGNCCQHQTSLV